MLMARILTYSRTPQHAGSGLPHAHDADPHMINDQENQIPKRAPRRIQNDVVHIAASGPGYELNQLDDEAHKKPVE